MAAINAALNLVLPVSLGEDGIPLVWAYHLPVTPEIVDANYRTLAATNTAIFGEGPSHAALNGIRIARTTFLDMCNADAAAYGAQPNVTGPSFLNELKRRTTIFVPSADKMSFVNTPVDQAMQANVLNDLEWRETEGALIFFTVSYVMARLALRNARAARLCRTIGGSMTSLGLTDYNAYLTKSTTDETSNTKNEPSLAVS